MRRLLVVCAVTLIVLAAFAATQRNTKVAAAGDSHDAAATAGITSTTKVTVVATGLSARALGLNPVDPHAAVYLTNAGAPNQVFAFAPASPTVNPTANVRVAAVAGTGTPGSLGDGGAAISAQMDLSESSLIERSAIAVAADGTVYVADTGNATIRAIAGPASTEPGVMRSAAGRWASQQSVTLVEPMGIALDRAGNLYIADHSAGAVDVMPANGGPLQTLAQITSPASIAVTPDGNTVFVASPETGAVFSITTQSREIKVVAGLVGSASQSASARACGALVDATTAASGAQQICPAGLAVDTNGSVLISDAHSGQILRLNPQTSAVSIVASGLNQPGALAIDASGNLYAAEQGLSRIVAFAQVGTSQGSISLTPTSAAYGNNAVGGVTATQSFTLANISSSAVTGLTIPKATSPADFTVQTNSCAATLPANSTCTLGIAFAPTTTGARSGTLVVTDANASDSASTVLTGTGDDFQIQLASGQLSSVSVQAGSSTTFNLQVVPDAVFSGAVTIVCPSNLPLNTTCTVSPTTVNVSAGVSAPFSVAFQTTGIINPLNTAAPGRNGPANNNAPSVPLLLFAAAAFVLAAFAFGPRMRAAYTFPIFAVVAFGMALIAGCHKGPTNASIGATPAGTTSMAVTGTSQNASRALTITLNVVAQ